MLHVIFLLSAMRPPSTRELRASPADVEAIASRLNDATVQGLFLDDGEPRRFLRREQFMQRVAALEGTGTPSDAALLELWMYFGGAPPREPVKKKTEGGFFAAFADTIKENAMGVKDERPKNAWGDTVKEMTVIDANVILDSDLARDGFSKTAFDNALS